MQLKPFSKKQRQVFSWWQQTAYDGVICDGTIRSGKTLCMGLSFVLWSMQGFLQQNFALCGKTLLSLKRNLVRELLVQVAQLGFGLKEELGQNYFELTLGARTNRYYLFDGFDESSAAKVQGITLGGVLFDEVALMPESFVNQTVARCSAEGAKFWFSCNPEHPYHWFYKEWIQKREEKNLHYLHFTMEDNPSLSLAVKKRYESLYTGAFYNRYVLGQWTQSSGIVYPDFHHERHVYKGEILEAEGYYLSCDYGMQNPFSLGLYLLKGGKVYRQKEYYYSGRQTGQMKTDLEYYEQVQLLAKGLPIQAIVVDPSASSFIALIAQRGEFSVIKANNNILAGISQVTQLMKENKLLVHESCEHCLRELALYRWDEKSSKDMPLQQHDHAMDEMRYLVSTIVFAQHKREKGFFVLSAPR